MTQEGNKNTSSGNEGEDVNFQLICDCNFPESAIHLIKKCSSSVTGPRTHLFWTGTQIYKNGRLTETEEESLFSNGPYRHQLNGGLWTPSYHQSKFGRLSAALTRRLLR